MDISLILRHIEEKYGYKYCNSYYEKVNEWESWWRGTVESFHIFYEKSGKTTKKRELYRLGMAKKICEDWASILLNEKTEITADHKASNSFLNDEKSGIFALNDFWSGGNGLVETAFRSGTGAFLLHLENGKKIRIQYLPANQIIPLSVQGRQVTEAAFFSVETNKGKEYLLLELHILEHGKYVIKNERFIIEYSCILRPAPLPENVPKIFYTQSEIPWFSLVKPNLVSNIPGSNGLGISVFAGAIDCLKAVDLAFNNFCRDFRLGGKKVFLHQSLIQYNDSGQPITPDDVMQQLFLQVGSEFDADKPMPVQEFNPSLRVEENSSGLQAMLNYLSFKCGLGSEYYKFEKGKVMTATQYMGDRQELVQNAQKHYLIIKQALQTLCCGALYIGRAFLSQPVRENCEISVKFEDSYIIDKESERERDRQDVRDGLMLPWEFRVKWYGEDEITAKNMLKPLSKAETSGV